MKKLIIFTKLFPYAKTEAFLEAEIKVLSKHFDEIVICPSCKHHYVRDLPPNARIDDSFLVKRNKFLLLIFVVIFNGKFAKYVYDHFRQIKSIADVKNIIRYAVFDQYFDNIYRAMGGIDHLNDSPILYSYWFSRTVNSLLRLKVRHNLNFEVVTRAHRWDIYEDEAIFPYRHQSISQLSAVFSISEDGRNYMETRYGNHEKIKVSRLGVMPHAYLAKQSSDNTFVLVSVSQITERKRVLLLFESLLNYALERPNVRFKWVHFGQGNLLEVLKTKICNNTVSNLEVELKGYVPNCDILTFYQSYEVDVFVNLSESEGVPVSIMEAQSFGIPVIATNVGGTSEIVNGEIGVLLNDNPSIDDVCKAIDEIIRKNISREFIKNEWSKISNAELNFTAFANELTDLQNV